MPKTQRYGKEMKPDESIITSFIIIFQLTKDAAGVMTHGKIKMLQHIYSFMNIIPKLQT